MQNLSFIKVNFFDAGFSGEIQQKLYTAFDLVWRDEYQIIDGYKLESSDKFLGFDSAIALMDGDQVIAALFYLRVDISNPLYLRHSFFSEWPSDAIRTVYRDSTTPTIITHLLVSPEYRSSPFGVVTSQLMVELGMVNFLNSEDELLIAALRNNRGVDKLCKHAGSELIQNVRLRNLDVDLVTFKKELISERLKSYSPLALDLYEKRRVYGSERISRAFQTENGTSTKRVG